MELNFGSFGWPACARRHPLRPRFPSESGLNGGGGKIRKLKGSRVVCQRGVPLGAQEVVNWLSLEAADIELLAIECDAAFRSDTSEHRLVRLQVHKLDASQVGRNQKRTTKQAVVDGDFTWSVRRKNAGGSRYAFDQPISANGVGEFR